MGEDCPHHGTNSNEDHRQKAIAELMHELSKEWKVPHAVFVDDVENGMAYGGFDGWGNVSEPLLVMWLETMLPYLMARLGYQDVARQVSETTRPVVKDLIARQKAWLS